MVISAVQRVIIRLRGVRGGVGIPGEVVTPGYFGSRVELDFVGNNLPGRYGVGVGVITVHVARPAKVGVDVVNPGINDTNFDVSPGDVVAAPGGRRADQPVTVGIVASMVGMRWRALTPGSLASWARSLASAWMAIPL